MIPTDHHHSGRLVVPVRPLLVSVLLVAGLFVYFPGFAHAAQDPSSISWSVLAIGLLGGLAFFLYGMEKMSDGMKKTAGNRMRSILEALTQNRVVALVVGAVVTMVIQSSSATTVMLVSFVQAELMTFAQSLGVILGADIGTTITAQMIAFKLTDYALVMVLAGFCMRFFGKSEQIKSIGDTILGFGILFYGMKMMSDAMKPLRSYSEFIDLMKGLENPLYGLLIGTAFTALVQSSSASTGVVIVLAQQGLITLEAGIPIIFGANIGTCITAGLASIGTSREAKRVAIAHVLFKVAGVLLFIWWIPHFASLMKDLAANFGAGTARQIANAHTVFNISIGLLFLPFIDLFARLVIWILPDRPVDRGVTPVVWHLDESMLSTPVLALDLARSEMARMAKIVSRMHFAVIQPLLSNTPRTDEIYAQLTLLEGIDMRKDKIDFLESRTRKYLLQISSRELDEEQAEEISHLLAILNNIRRISDIITRVMLPQIERKNSLELDFSEEGKNELLEYHQKAGKQLERLESALQKGTKKLAKKIKKKESRYNSLDQQIRQQHIQRLLEDRPESIETHRIHMAMIDAIKQINIYVASIAEQILSMQERESLENLSDNDVGQEASAN